MRLAETASSEAIDAARVDRASAAVVSDEFARLASTHARCPRDLARAKAEIERLEDGLSSMTLACDAAKRDAFEAREVSTASIRSARNAALISQEALANSRAIAAKARAEADALSAEVDGLRLRLSRVDAQIAQTAKESLFSIQEARTCAEGAAARETIALTRLSNHIHMAAQKELENAQKPVDDCVACIENAQVVEEATRILAAQAATTIFTPPPPVVAVSLIDDDTLALESLVREIRSCGMTKSQLVVFVDCTKSNEKGSVSFGGGRSLHDVSSSSQMNPYQTVISIFGQFLAPFDDDGLIPLFGFGDKRTADDSVFPFHEGGNSVTGVAELFCQGLEGVLSAYSNRIASVVLAGPTSFAPAIRKTIELVKRTSPREFTFALIIADGQVNSTRETISAIIEASSLPISIVCIGVGDGPWDQMMLFDDELHTAIGSNGTKQKFDNYHFTHFDGISTGVKMNGGNLAAALIKDALSEVPQQYKDCQRLRLIGGW